MKPLRLLLPAVIALLLAGSGCLFHTRIVETRLSTAKLQSATQEELIARLNHDAGQIKTLNLTVDIDTSVGGEKKGQVTDFKEIRGYILVRRPNLLRLIGLFPIVRNKAFDLVSDGTSFKLYVPAKNKFYVGHNEVLKPAENPLGNIRPQQIYDALLLREVDPQNEIAVLEDGTEMVVDAQTKKLVKQSNYVLNIIQNSGDKWFLARKVMFDRTNLTPHRQVVYDKLGNVATDARYQVFTDYNGIRFPGVIDIQRPQEEFNIRLLMVKATINQDLGEDQFALEQPPGTQLVNVDQQNVNASSNRFGGTENTPAGTSQARR